MHQPTKQLPAPGSAAPRSAPRRRKGPRHRAKLGALAVVSLGSLLASCSPGREATQAQTPATAGAVVEGVVAEGAVPSLLQHLREEERLARDVYRTLHQRWGARIFENISGAEQRHMDRLGALLAARGIPDPVTNDEVGVFHDAGLRALYQDLVQRGAGSLLDALQVGATIEDLDLRDIATLRAQLGAQDQDALAAVDQLACGSRNHMRAFTRQIERRGGHYTPQYIDGETYAAILAGAHERCGGGGRGQGGARGMGRGGGMGHGGGMGRGGGMGHGGGMGPGGGCGMGHGGAREATPAANN